MEGWFTVAREIQTSVTLVDDVNGSVDKSVETVRVFDPRTGAAYELEMGKVSQKAWAGLCEELDAFLGVARPVKRARSKRTTRTVARKGRRDNAEIRAWAAQNGYDVAERGAIPAKVVAAYEARPL